MNSREAEVPPSADWQAKGRQRSVYIDWFHEGETKRVEVDGVTVTIRFVGRKGRRGRIAIEAPTGAVFTGLNTFSQD